MPVGNKRAQAAKERWQRKTKDGEPRWSRTPLLTMYGPQFPAAAPVNVRGTGWRHRPKTWSTKGAANKAHKVVLPVVDGVNKAVLVIGDSHLRSCVDGIVPADAREGCTFGFASTPGASANELEMEVAEMKIPANIDAVCLLAPGNNLTSSTTIEKAGEDFASLLRLVKSKSLVFVVGFPRRLNVDMEVQTGLSRIYHQQAAQLGVRYYDIEEYFPICQLDLWSKDSVHLSDTVGMPRLVSCFAHFASLELCRVPPEAPVSPVPTAPRRQVRPRVVATGEVNVSLPRETLAPVSPVPRAGRVLTGEVEVSPSRETFDWQNVGGKKLVRVSLSRLSKQQVDSALAGLCRQEVDSAVAEFSLQQDDILLSPVRFTSTFLDAADEHMELSSCEPVIVSGRPRRKRVAPALPACSEPKRKALPQVDQSRMHKRSSTEPKCGAFPKGTHSKRHERWNAELQTKAFCQPALPEMDDQSWPALPQTVFTPGPAIASNVAASSTADFVPSEIRPPSREAVLMKDGFQLRTSAALAGPAVEGQVAASSTADFVPSEIRPPSREAVLMKDGFQLRTSAALAGPAVEGQVTASSRVEFCPPEFAAPSAWEAVQMVDGFQLQASPTVPSSVTGTFHQGSDRFVFPGLQCMAVGLVSLAVHTVKSVFTWNSDTLDTVVLDGDKLYTSVQMRRPSGAPAQMLYVRDLPEKHHVAGQTFQFEHGEDFVSGVVDVKEGRHIDNGILKSLFKGLTETFEKYDTCLLTVGHYCCALITDEGKYAVVDSHSRNAVGMPEVDGTSCVVYFSRLQDLYDHVCKLAAALNVSHQQFEVAGVRVTRGAKRKLTWPSELSEKLQRLDDLDVVVTDVSSRDLKFCPLNKALAETLCTKLRVELDHVKACCFPAVGPLGPPCKKESIVADGNCFFRAVSLAVTGTQDHHRKVRLAVVKQLATNAVDYNLRTGFSSMAHYLETTRMRYVHSWATEVEIQAAADYLGVHIFTLCEGRWLQFSCKQSNFPGHGIYLENVNGNHYETVVCVCKTQIDSCYGLCKTNEPTAKGYKIRRRTAETCSVAGSTSTHASTVGNITSPVSKYLKRKNCLEKRLQYEDSVFRQEKNLSKIRKYQTDGSHSNQVRLTSKTLYRENVVYKQTTKEKSRLKYNTNLLFRQKVKAYSTTKYKQDVLFRQKVKANSTSKYEHDEMFRQKVKGNSSKKYKHDEVFRQKVKGNSSKKYKQDEVFRQKVKGNSSKKYKQDEVFRQKVKAYSTAKYKLDVSFRQKVKSYSTSKYKENVSYRQKIKTNSILKYRMCVLHRYRVMALNKKRYKNNALYRQREKARSKAVYHGSNAYRERISQANKLKRLENKIKQTQFEIVMTNFLHKVNDGPEFVCCVCHKLLFKPQALQCQKSDYALTRCISEQYVHTCSHNCAVPCQLLLARGMLRICHKCHTSLRRGVMPPECALNNLSVEPVPPQLACLKELERDLVSLQMCFMKLLALPKGGQNGVHGPVTCVPTNISQTTNVLPRSSMEGSLIRVKLKRKLSYKGHYKYQFVDTLRVKEAVQYLKANNLFYKDIEYNESWNNDFCLEQDNDVAQETDSHAESGGASADAEEEELLHDRQQHCMFQDTCLMPVDIGQETLDQYFDDVLNLAPAEGNSPVRLLSDYTNEAKCFPTLFPSGRGTYHDARQHRLTLARYFNNRILHADGRFAHDTSYIFRAQYLSELQQVVSNVSIALRKGRGGARSQNISQQVLQDEEALKKLLQFDDGYRFLKPIRGTPSFWQGAQRDLLACVRQLGVPTWFCSFSSADLRWQNLLRSILKQAGRTETVEQLDWAEKCELLRANPVTAARMFDFRWHCFLREVLMSPCNPIGKITDYFYRVEFQQRGSPHVHCLFWIENAPVIDKNTDDEVIQFIDHYVTCELPAHDEALLDTVTSVQQHSKRHSKSCKKNKSVCRFNFPRPPSAKTFISRPVKEEVGKTSCTCKVTEAQTLGPCACKTAGQNKPHIMKRDFAAAIVTKIKQALSEDGANFESVDALFTHLRLNQKTFENAYNRVGRKTQVVLKRQPNEVWINQYSKPLLKCWNANIDIQYVVDAYACVVYIISYISKAEKEMGLLLANAQREATKEGNSSAKDALKKLGGVYLHNRDVCAQEAVYRLTNMHLKECSRKVVFVPVGKNTVRMSLPLSVLKQKASSHDLNDDDLWMRSSVDRYKSRPQDSTFNNMCLATFASEYRVVSKNEKAVKRVKLNNDCGFVVKRTRTQPAVVRYVRFSQTKNPELFYQSLLQLFLPYHKDAQLKPPGFETFEQFYLHGSVRFTEEVVHSVKQLVDQNRCKFEQDADELDDIQNAIDSDGVAEDAWCELCPEQELERLECIEERREAAPMEEEPVEDIPDLAINRKDVANVDKRQNTLTREDGLALVRTLNETQMHIFYQIRQWCLQIRNGAKPDPLHVFITGGAGTGKSHLIKAIQYEAMRLLAKVCRAPDEISVLLTAPTGIAAHNLHASTIHSALSIGKDVRLPYTPLGEEKLNSLRAKYSSVHLLIIDEISMVDDKLLSYIHGRLRQIRQSGDYSPFGNVSVVAVGDFYQLPPVKGTPLYLNKTGVGLWCQWFKVAELKTIVRQKDPSFAEMLNRVRTRSKGTPMLDSDIKILKRCETGEVSSALHIFATNKQVNEHNLKQLFESCPDYVKIEAQDYVNSTKTGKLELIKGHHSRSYDTCLDETLLLGKGARVMLLKNLDVADGLVNGVCGTVTHIVYPQHSTTQFPQTVYVKFDDDMVGVLKRTNCAFASAVEMGSTSIEPEEDRVTKKGGMRRQFPLKLAWACTVHKVQGITVNAAVVSLDRIFAAGQAYVALSRVRDLSGLIIKDFNEKKIYCKDAIKDELEKMPPFMVKNITGLTFNTPTFTVFVMNVQNLTRHVTDLALCTKPFKLHCIAVTETWLPAVSSFEDIQMDGYAFHSQPRSLSYSSSNPTLTEIQGQQHGGVGLYSANNLAFTVLQVPHINLECLVSCCTTYNMLLAVIYRPPSYTMTLFKENLGKLLDWLTPKSDTIAVMGDFNDDILKTSSIATFMTSKGFVQTVKQPTTENGTLIDHVYVKTTHYNVESLVVPTYFSDHEGIICSFTSST